jgi:hypothetical protein
MIRRVFSMSIVALFALSAILARGQDTTPKPPAAPVSAAAPASTTDADLARRVAALERQVAELKQSRDELLNIVTNHSTMLHDVVADRQTPSGGKYFVPNVQAIRDDRDARRELVDTVVQGMTRSTGELQIRNDMGTGQSLVINGVDSVYVPAHSQRTVTVPSGTATTELAGEGTKSWMIGAPNYSQEVIIAPAVRSASSPWQYDPLTGGWWRTLP